VRARATVGLVSVVVALACGVALASNGAAVSIPVPPVKMLGRGSVSPVKLPRLRRVPVTLQMGFQSIPVPEGPVPELDEISFEVARRIEFAPESWPQSCSLAKLYSPRVDARRTCSESLVGHGTVASEITIPGQAPVSVTGRLLAFYALAGGRPRILAQVTTGEPLPLVYVIPFTIKSANGRYRTTLSVPRRRMRAIAGQCAPGYPNCFAPSPYTLKGVYGHISEMTLSLHRVLRMRHHRLSFVKGHCPTPGSATEPLLRMGLAFADKYSTSATITARCKARGI
jgi:hypothetical protein